MAPSKDQSGGRDHAVGALPARQPRTFFDAINRDVAGAPKNGKHRPISEEIDRVIAPFAVGHLAPVEAQNAIELTALEHDRWGGGEPGGGGVAPARLAGVSFAWP